MSLITSPLVLIRTQNSLMKALFPFPHLYYLLQILIKHMGNCGTVEIQDDFKSPERAINEAKMTWIWTNDERKESFEESEE